MSDLWVFVGALAVAYLLPGPDMLLMLETGARGGRAATLAAATGLAAARACHLLLSALGVAALLRAVPWLFDVVRIAGAAYLCWLGVQVLRHGVGRAEVTTGELRPAAWSAAFRRGLLTNLLNPKALLFCSVLLPQFVHPERGGVTMQLVVLGVVLLVLGLGFDLFYGLGGQGAGRWLGGRPMARRVQGGAFATILMLFGVRLLLTSRP